MEAFQCSVTCYRCGDEFDCSEMQPHLKQNNTYLYPPTPPLPFFLFLFLFFLAVSCDLVDLGTFSFWGGPVRLTGPKNPITN